MKIGQATQIFISIDTHTSYFFGKKRTTEYYSQMNLAKQMTVAYDMQNIFTCAIDRQADKLLETFVLVVLGAIKMTKKLLGILFDGKVKS